MHQKCALKVHSILHLYSLAAIFEHFYAFLSYVSGLYALRNKPNYML